MREMCQRCVPVCSVPKADAGVLWRFQDYPQNGFVVQTNVIGVLSLIVKRMESAIAAKTVTCNPDAVKQEREPLGSRLLCYFNYSGEGESAGELTSCNPFLGSR